MLDRLSQPFILLVVAPSLFEASRVVDAAGIQRGNGCVRVVQKAHCLRSWRHGTPVLTGERGHWCATHAGEQLWLALDTYLASGKLRIAQDDDIARAITEGV